MAILHCLTSTLQRYNPINAYKIAQTLIPEAALTASVSYLLSSATQLSVFSRLTNRLPQIPAPMDVAKFTAAAVLIDRIMTDLIISGGTIPLESRQHDTGYEPRDFLQQSDETESSSKSSSKHKKEKPSYAQEKTAISKYTLMSLIGYGIYTRFNSEASFKTFATLSVLAMLSKLAIKSSVLNVKGFEVLQQVYQNLPKTIGAALTAGLIGPRIYAIDPKVTMIFTAAMSVVYYGIQPSIKLFNAQYSKWIRDRPSDKVKQGFRAVSTLAITWQVKNALNLELPLYRPAFKIIGVATSAISLFDRYFDALSGKALSVIKPYLPEQEDAPFHLNRFGNLDFESMPIYPYQQRSRIDQKDNERLDHLIEIGGRTNELLESLLERGQRTEEVDFETAQTIDRHGGKKQRKLRTDEQTEFPSYSNTSTRGGYRGGPTTTTSSKYDYQQQSEKHVSDSDEDK